MTTQPRTLTYLTTRDLGFTEAESKRIADRMDVTPSVGGEAIYTIVLGSSFREAVDDCISFVRGVKVRDSLDAARAVYVALIG